MRIKVKVKLLGMQQCPADGGFAHRVVPLQDRPIPAEYLVDVTDSDLHFSFLLIVIQKPALVWAKFFVNPSKEWRLALLALSAFHSRVITRVYPYILVLYHIQNHAADYI